MHTYRLYGIILQSEIPLPELAQVSVRLTNQGEKITFAVRNFRPILGAKMIPHRGLSYWLSPDRKRGLVHSRVAGTFRLDFVERKIDWKPLRKSDTSGFARLLLRGKVLGFFLSCMPDRFLLHASVVCRGNRGILFCGAVGQGKSTMTAAFLNEAFHLLSDDTAVIRQKKHRLTVESGAPEIRLWPESASRLRRGNPRPLPLYKETLKKRFILNGESSWKFIKKSVDLAAVYILSRQKTGKIFIDDLNGQEALIAVLQNMYLPVIEDPDLSGDQFKLVAQLIRETPVKRLRYPSGYRHLPEIHAAIRRDLSKK